jgi:hypothetical protein
MYQRHRLDVEPQAVEKRCLKCVTRSLTVKRTSDNWVENIFHNERLEASLSPASVLW